MKILIMALCLPLLLLGSDSYEVTEVKWEGINRTSLAWITSYLDLEKCPCTLTAQNLRQLESRILTTTVFSAAKLTVEPHSTQPEKHILTVQVEEKWTLLPVMRFQLGGGTPLTILGLYNTHSFGKLLTLGGEAHKYGEDPWGVILYANFPRWLDGRYYIGAEYWKQFRGRNIVDAAGKDLASLRSEVSKIRFKFLSPLGSEGWQRQVQWGFNLFFRSSRNNILLPVAGETGQEFTSKVAFKEQVYTEIWPTIIYDALEVDNALLDGVRILGRAGYSYSLVETYPVFLLEAFYYSLLSSVLNLGAHLYWTDHSSNNLNALTYLGGFNSLRGRPDGAYYGSKALYGNFEMRYLAARWHYLWVQTSLFYDVGAATFEASELLKELHHSVGFGVRLTVPQVYRLMFRLEVAYTLDDPKQWGISLGMADFFEPYSPL